MLKLELPARTQYSLFAIPFLVAFTMVSTVSADTWPQWMGPKRDGVWREKNIIEKFGDAGPQIVWRTNVNKGYCGPAVVGDRLYMLDRLAGPPLQRKPGDKSIPAAAGNERVLCLDAKSGNQVWEHTYDCPYRIGYPAGPRATPIVADGKLYTLGAMGDLLCLNAEDGKVLWEHHFIKDYELADPPTWGWAAHPLLDGERLICMVGGTNSVVVAFNKDTGKEMWRALSAPEIGYAPPQIQTIAGKRQLIIWHPDAIAGLEPETGKVLWTQKYPASGKLQRPEVTIAMPRVVGDRIFVTSYYHGSLLTELTNNPLGARIVWDRHSKSESHFDAGLHTTMTTPVWLGDYIYGLCGEGELRCLDAKTGDRIWESDAVAGKAGPFATVFFVQQEDRVFVWNDQGELILGRLTPKGFEQISKARLLETIENTRGRDVLWCHPAFANRRAYVHNGKELICIELGIPARAG
jgi:outer membrane protein assembly factor BamB